ncbi:gag-pol fusion protein [Pimephales promelas]|nr:gag-pol fusion protein [Pimephales promelas]
MTLRHCLGVEGQRIFHNLGTPNDYDAAVTLLDDSFHGPSKDLVSLPFIEGTSCEKTRKKLLLEADDLTLSRAVDIALQIETAMECMSQLAGARPLADGATEQLQPAYHTSMHPANDSRGSEKGFPVQFTQRQNNRRTAQLCGNCGSKSHNSKAEHCPAKGQQCRNGLKQNHFAKMCRSTPATLPQHTGPPPAQHNYTEIRNVTADHPATALCGYDSSRIDILGVLHMPVHYGSKHLPSFPFHIARRGANLLGLDPFTGLGFTLRDNAGSDIHHITSTWQQRWPALFNGLACLSAFTHRPLVNPDVPPVIQPLRRIPFALRDEITRELGTLLDMGIIEPVNAAPWISNLVIAKKKIWRNKNMCGFTLEELTAQFYGSTVFTKLDLRQGYLQVPLHPASRDLTAFVTHAGVFRYTLMAFGLSSAPSCFQKVMSTILAGIPGVAVFLDDIVNHAQHIETHNKHLQRVAQALLQNNLTLNPEKCCFAAPAIDFVGFRLSVCGEQENHATQRHNTKQVKQ